MKPYYDAHGITLYVADCREVLPTLPVGGERGGVELILTDPPYGVSATATSHRTRALPLDSIAHDDSTDVGKDGVILAWSRLHVHRHAYVFGPFDLAELPGAMGTCELIWDKVSPTMGDVSHPWAKQHEPIQFAMRNRAGPASAKEGGGQLARVRRGTVLRYQRQNATGAKYHIADKPVPLLRELIEMSSRHGETVLDPFCGSGSALVAALLEGRSAIGIELEEPWAEIAAKRLDEAMRQGCLFGNGAA